MQNLSQINASKKPQSHAKMEGKAVESIDCGIRIWDTDQYYDGVEMYYSSRGDRPFLNLIRR